MHPNHIDQSVNRSIVQRGIILHASEDHPIVRPLSSGTDNLSELTANRARNGLGRVHIGEESLRVLLNLLDVEALALVNTLGVLNTSLEPILADDAANAATDVLADRLGVGEGDARGTGLALGGFVDVRGRDGGRLVLAAEVVEGDVVADGVGVGVQAELVEAAGAFEAAGEFVVGVDDFFRDGFDFVGGGELDWEMC